MARLVLFFDDYPRTPENILFVWRLRQRLRSQRVQVIKEKSIHKLEARLKSELYIAIVLDIMAAMPDEEDKDALAGLEILKRCRTGLYTPEMASVPIFMRTARGELYIRHEASALGASGYFMAGSEDSRLIDTLAAIAEGQANVK